MVMVMKLASAAVGMPEKVRVAGLKVSQAASGISAE